MSAPRITLYNDEIHVVSDRELEVGDVLPAYRGNGPREGERMGWAIVTGVEPVPRSVPKLSLDLIPDEEAIER